MGDEAEVWRAARRAANRGQAHSSVEPVAVEGGEGLANHRVITPEVTGRPPGREGQEPRPLERQPVGDRVEGVGDDLERPGLDGLVGLHHQHLGTDRLGFTSAHPPPDPASAGLDRRHPHPPTGSERHHRSFVGDPA